MRIIVNQSATDLAAHFAAEGGEFFFLSDEELAATIGVGADRVYRALDELAEMNALHYTKPNRLDAGRRTITIYSHHWIWEALRQGGAR